ncbi:LysR family transcriptional regulator [Palleronia aestuarii]|uniref:LysR family transcriptional regulator n=1 Tax=Palleronia aestuarii TaxID=568105 RepID=UPI000DABCCDF|nr:LysR family transcriptional regulator [Palleronia aestuarii]
MTNWDEIRTAFHVARIGTVSGAAEALGVHHSTVIRHVDALEGRMGVRLFQRHARGYTPTEAGADLLRVAQATEDQFTQLSGRIRGAGESVAGELVITSLATFSALLTPILVKFQARHPGLVVRSLTSERLYRLQYGEAHVAIRAGAASEEPDNVVQPFGEAHFALYATRDYLERRGMPESDADLATHDFIVHDNPETPAPFYRWLHETVPAERLVFRATDDRVLRDAVEAGAGIGFISTHDAPPGETLVRVMAPRPEWTAHFWLVTHMDLHRTTKVQSFLAFLKSEAKGWSNFEVE